MRRYSAQAEGEEETLGRVVLFHDGMVFGHAYRFLPAVIAAMTHHRNFQLRRLALDGSNADRPAFHLSAHGAQHRVRAIRVGLHLRASASTSPRA